MAHVHILYTNFKALGQVIYLVTLNLDCLMCNFKYGQQKIKYKFLLLTLKHANK